MDQDLLEFLREPSRLRALEERGLLDHAGHPALDRLTRLTAIFLEAPLALVNIITADQQISKSRYAPPAWPEGRTASLADSFCKYPVVTRLPLVVDDVRADPALAVSAMAAAQGVSAYAAVPLITPDGHALGTLCVVDFVPRAWNERELQILRDLAEGVLTELELRRDLRQRARVEEALRQREEELRLLHHIAAMANEAARFEDILQESLNAICAYTGWTLGHAYRLDGDSTLVPTNVWAANGVDGYAGLRRETAGLVFRAGQGLPGSVLGNGRPAWIADLKQEPNVIRESLWGEGDLHAALAFPVLAGSEIVAVLEFFSPEVKAPNPALLEVMANVGTQMGRVVERQRVEARLRAEALSDAVTGLANRLGFYSLAEQQLILACRMDQEVALFFIDLDGMKLINDTLGHQMGDVALVETARLLRQTFRASDIIGRLGGDEFVVFALDVPQGRTGTLLDRFEQHLAEANTLPGRPYALRMSVGVVDVRAQEVASLQELVEEADRRMYHHKQSKADGTRVS